MAYFRIDRTLFSIDRSRRDVSLKLLLSQRAMERAVGRKKSPYNLSNISIKSHLIYLHNTSVVSAAKFSYRQ